MQKNEFKDRKVAPIVALDIGNVCIRVEAEECAKELGFGSIEEIEKGCPEILQMALHLETGAISSGEFLRQLSPFVKGEVSHELLEEIWNIIIGEEIIGMAEVVQEIFSLGMTPIFFSNISDIHFTCIKKKLSFADQIIHCVLSYEVGEVKPHSTIYEVMENEYCEGGVPALYLDDKIENISAGMRRGWNSYQVGDLAGIRKKLSELEECVNPLH